MPFSVKDTRMRAVVGTGRRVSALISVSELPPLRATTLRIRTARSITWMVIEVQYSHQKPDRVVGNSADARADAPFPCRQSDVAVAPEGAA